MALHASLVVPVALHWCTAACIVHAPSCVVAAAQVSIACMTKETLDHEAYQAIAVLSKCIGMLKPVESMPACWQSLGHSREAWTQRDFSSVACVYFCRCLKLAT